MSTLHILDDSTLRGLRELAGDEPQSLLDELFVLLFSNAQVQLDEIRQAGARGDLDAVMRAAHTLKGGAGSVGAQEVAHHASEIEHQARKRAGADWPRLADELEQALQRLRDTASDLGLKTAA